MSLGGYHGQALRVDVTSGRVEPVSLPEEALRRFVGGVGLGTWLLHRESPAGVDPLAPDAALVLSLAPLVGTPLTTSAKFAVVAKSPLTDRISDALASDRFALELKGCGLDAFVLRGRAPRWSLVVVEDGAVRIEDAKDLLGLPSIDAEHRVRQRLGSSFRFFGIGPAGELQVRFATISGDNRHAGRGGLGAVLGAKRIKGIAVRGTRRTPLADPDRVLAIAKDLSKRSLGEGTAKYRELGTVANVLILNRLGTLPTRNFQAGTFEGAEMISGEALHAMRGRVRKHCAACTIGCEHVFPRKNGRGVRLEYEGLFALGPLLGIDDREAVLEAAGMCDDLGVDVISAGGTLAFAMECRERELLVEAPLFGDAAGALSLLSDIGARRGLGAVLGEGSRRAAGDIGGGAEAYACHVKGMELPGYDPRALQTLAVGLAVGARGADHNRSGAYEADLRPGADRLSAASDKGKTAAASEDRAAILDSLIVCKFLRGAFEDLEAECAAMLSAVTGWDVGPDELRRTAARIVSAKKLFNVREGWARAEDTLPPRFFAETLDGGLAGEAALSRRGLDRMIATYYRARGWTEDGRVPPDVVRALDLEDLVGAGRASPTGEPRA